MKLNLEKKNRPIKRLFNIDETAEYIGIKKNTLYQWANQRRIESVHIGRKLLFDKKYLDELIEARKMKPRDEIKL